MRYACISALLYVYFWLALVPEAEAQLVNTEARAFRLNTGVLGTPSDEDENGKRHTEYYALLSGTYRFGDHLDLGLGLPALLFAPEVDLANPYVFGTYAFIHKPVWLALGVRAEPPLFYDTDFRTSIWFGANFFLGDLFEFVSFPWIRVPFLNTSDLLYGLDVAFVWNVVDIFAMGPVAGIRYDIDGYDTYSTGWRARFVWNEGSKTIASFFITAAFNEFQFTSDQLYLFATSTWFVEY
ncbi:MAG: hypothetical protein IPJ88_11265 [Myxococcales bacterium]|nr:MAG: hypothetical protein IPJ88_11265 [Myxococcales bacterium]